MTNLQNSPFDANSLELLFAHRNKAYGAYDLRCHYDKNIRRASLMTFLLLGIFIASTYYKSEAKVIERDTSLVVCTMPPPMVLKPLKPKIKVAPVKVTPSSSKFLVPKILDDDKVTQKPDTVSTPPSSNVGNTPPSDAAIIGGGDDMGTGIAPIEPEPPAVPEPEPPAVPKPEPPAPEPTPTLIIAEEMPEFKGGLKEMMRYIQAHLIYPPLAREIDISGTVAVQFIVDEYGKISDIEIKRDIGAGCGQEAVRVVANMPDWKPGKQNGKNVKVRFTLPIKFRLE